MAGKTFRNIMVDIETMGKSTTRSLLLSAALIPFTLYEDGIEKGDPLLVLLDFAQQLGQGRIIDASTQKFWMDQPDDAREHWADPEYKLTDGVLKRLKCGELAYELSAFIRENTVDKSPIWANGVTFDMGNLENLIETNGKTVPWDYNVGRDLRTIRRCSPVVRELSLLGHVDGGASFAQANLRAHDPVDDCIFQIGDLWRRLPAGSEAFTARPPNYLSKNASTGVAVG